MFMKLVSISYDLTTSNIQSNRTLNSLNEYFFGIREGQGEIEGLPVSESYSKVSKSTAVGMRIVNNSNPKL